MIELDLIEECQYIVLFFYITKILKNKTVVWSKFIQTTV